MDLNLVLIIFLIILTINLTVITVYLISTLNQLKKTLIKLENVLDDTSVIVHNVANPFNMLSGLVSGISSYFKRSDSIRSIRR